MSSRGELLEREEALTAELQETEAWLRRAGAALVNLGTPLQKSPEAVSMKGGPPELRDSPAGVIGRAVFLDYAELVEYVDAARITDALKKVRTLSSELAEVRRQLGR